MHYTTKLDAQDIDWDGRGGGGGGGGLDIRKLHIALPVMVACKEVVLGRVYKQLIIILK